MQIDWERPTVVDEPAANSEMIRFYISFGLSDGRHACARPLT